MIFRPYFNGERGWGHGATLDSKFDRVYRSGLVNKRSMEFDLRKSVT